MDEPRSGFFFGLSVRTLGLIALALLFVPGLFTVLWFWLRGVPIR